MERTLERLADDRQGPHNKRTLSGGGTGDIPDDNCTAISPLDVVKYPLTTEFIFYGEIETQNAFVACELAALGEGVTIVDTITATRFGDRVALVPVCPSVPIQFNVLLPPTTAPSALVHTLMDLVADVMGETATIHRNHR